MSDVRDSQGDPSEVLHLWTRYEPEQGRRPD